MSELRISRDLRTDFEHAAAFFHDVRKGRDEQTSVPGGYGSYPYVYSVVLGDQEYIAFDTELPDDRDPWYALARKFSRDTVLKADTLDEVEGDDAKVVRHLVSAFADDVNGDETVADLTEESESGSF